MSADELEDFYVHTVTVEPFLGTSGYGEDMFGPASTLSPDTENGVFLDDSRKLVRDATGEQVVSESTLYTYPTAAALFNPGARVTSSAGVVSRVIRANVNDSGSLDLPDHVAVSLK